jgi:hypothetical protein
MMDYIILKFTYIKLNVKELKCTSVFTFNYIRTFPHLMEGAGFFLSIFFYCNT